MGSLAVSEAPSIRRFDSDLIAKMRLVLSSSVLFIFGPSEIDISLESFHIVAVLYTAYSAFLCTFVGRWVHQRLARISHWAACWIHQRLAKMSHWADVGWATLLVAFNDDSSLAFLFLFPALIASFEWSFVAALRLTFVAAQLLVAMSFFKSLGAQQTLPEIILPPLYLLVFGYLVACWGDRETTTKRRLTLLKELSRLSNPRFGIDRTIGTLMERLRAFYAAETCLMIVTDSVADQHWLRRASRHDLEAACEVKPIPAETARLMLAPSLDQALVFFGPPRLWERWLSPEASYYFFDVRKGQRIAAAPAIDEALITIVDAESFISVPLYYSDTTIGRLYLTAARRRAFSSADLGFLLQVVEQMVPVIENIRLVDQLASSAAEEERRRLARDIHDNVIQSYIGFQIGLAAVSQKLLAGGGDITNDIAQLRAITDQEIGALRHYVRRLPESGSHESALLAAVRRFAATFTEVTHVEVQVDAGPDLRINDRLAAEVFQMVVEGLSNIRRHTHAACASIGLICQDDRLLLRIANDDVDGVTPAPFSPRSIGERAAALGGHARVERVVGGGAQVIVNIPL